jgi:hypothetical protein
MVKSGENLALTHFFTTNWEQLIYYLAISIFSSPQRTLGLVQASQLFILLGHLHGQRQVLQTRQQRTRQSTQSRMDTLQDLQKLFAY